MYICKAKAKEVFNIHGESLGMEGERALYYTTDIGRHRIYRSSYPTPNDKRFKLFRYKKKETAQMLCDEINEAYNDDFEPILVEDDANANK